MKQLILLTFSFILFGTACKSTETSPNKENRPAIPEPYTIAQSIEENPERQIPIVGLMKIVTMKYGTSLMSFLPQ
ncbi:hypothetical protein [Rhodohalobacter sp.]|uniref:hypothetical protein n=1 Tax=Rhodohalobacter sp. TaxID=1974210 RepID=UPI0035683A3E